MFSAIITLCLLGLILGIILGAAASFFAVESNPLQAEIEAMLPGSQCGQCGHPGCTPAAAALAQGDAEITLCPPGGSRSGLTTGGQTGCQRRSIKHGR